MARTFGGLIFYGPENITVPTAQAGTAGSTIGLVRNALGDVSLNNNAAGVLTYNFFADISEIKRPFFNWPAGIGQGTVLTSNELQEVFGASSSPGNPFSGGQTGSQFGTPTTPWGLSIIDIFAVYSVQSSNLTTATLGLNRATYTENTAFTNTAVLAATGISVANTTSATTPHVQKVSLAQPLSFEANDISSLSIELLLTTAAASLIRVYGIGAHVAIEYA